MSEVDDALIAAIVRADLRSVARSISRIESEDDTLAPVLKALYLRGGHTPVIGITGPPGAGKSSLVDGLISQYRQRNLKVAVLAVDPSSPYTGGAILGDRVRMYRHSTDTEVFIRSMAARGRLGGLARAAGEALMVLDAMGWDAILVETVGVGQSEIEVLRHAQTVVIVQTPGAGDAVQAVKSGLIETGDIFVMNKADLPGADRAISYLREALEFRLQQQDVDVWQLPILKTQANEDGGIAALFDTLQAHGAHQAAHPLQRTERLRAQARALLAERVADALRQRQPATASASTERLLDALVARECDPLTAATRVLNGLA